MTLSLQDGPGAVREPQLEAEELSERGLAACVGEPPIVLEIGFGRAELIASLAAQRPGQPFLGIEVSRKRVSKAARRLVREGIRNARLIHSSAEYVLERTLPPGCVGECWINCPDPWPKKRHFRRRLIQTEFLRSLVRVLAPRGLVHLSTDHVGYAGWIAERLPQVRELENLHAPHPWSEAPPERPETAYEASFREEGRAIVYFDYRRR